MMYGQFLEKYQLNQRNIYCQNMQRVMEKFKICPRKDKKEQKMTLLAQKLAEIARNHSEKRITR